MCLNKTQHAKWYTEQNNVFTDTFKTLNSTFRIAFVIVQFNNTILIFDLANIVNDN